MWKATVCHTSANCSWATWVAHGLESAVGGRREGHHVSHQNQMAMDGISPSATRPNLVHFNPTLICDSQFPSQCSLL